jgi:hypothetical protein
MNVSINSTTASTTLHFVLVDEKSKHHLFLFSGSFTACLPAVGEGHLRTTIEVVGCWRGGLTWRCHARALQEHPSVAVFDNACLWVEAGLMVAEKAL